MGQGSVIEHHSTESISGGIYGEVTSLKGMKGMPLSGGASDKAGLRYELLWTVRCLIRLMKGEFDSIWLEPAGEEGEGVEFAITTSDGTEYHQVKRQLTGKGVWSLSELS